MLTTIKMRWLLDVLLCTPLLAPVLKHPPTRMRFILQDGTVVAFNTRDVKNIELYVN